MPMLEKMRKNVFWPSFRPKLVEMAQNYFFMHSDAKSFPTRGHMPMFERNYENWYIWSQNGLSGPFWPLFRPKLVKMAQNHYFLASDAKLFPTRGHMPMFEQNYENWYIWSHGSSINFGRFWSIFAYFEAKYLQNGLI